MSFFSAETAMLNRFVWAMIFLGLVLRITLTLVAGNRPVAPFSGVGDQIRYQTLADSIFHGDGFTYAGQPTALRPPIYPILLAGAHLVFGSHFFFAVRIFQFFVGIGIAYICLLLAQALFVREAGIVSFALALVLPTLVLSSVELQTENLATFVTALFLYFALLEVRGDRRGSTGLGLTSGLAALIRFNSSLLPVMGAGVCLWFRRSLKDAAIVCVLVGALLSPWIVRNLAVFHGSVIYSSHGGINLLEGVLSPEGRAQKTEGERVRAAVGWLHTDIEVNDPHRLQFGSEDVLNKQAKVAAFLAWKKTDWKTAVRLLGEKLSWFWLSLDQLLETSSFSPMQRKVRAAGVLCYWVVLIFASLGLAQLWATSLPVAKSIVLYMTFVTFAHLPFVMNTRLRIPFIDPLLVVLSAGGIVFANRKIRAAVRGSRDQFSKVNIQPAIKHRAT